MSAIFLFASTTGRGMVRISTPSGIVDMSPDPAEISTALCGLNPGQVISVSAPTRFELVSLCHQLDAAAVDRVKVHLDGDRVTFTRLADRAVRRAS